MSRPLRICFEDALYHVTSRGNEKARIYLDDKDRFVFMRHLAKVVEQYSWVLYAYCLMGNHYHLLVRTPKANLSRGMRQLNGVYAQYFNSRHDRVGHLFQGRFKGILIKDEDRLLAVACYVVLNPIRAEMVADPEDWRWSSYRGTAGINKPTKLFDPGQILCFFSDDRESARRQYAAFVKGGIGKESPPADARGGIITGEEKVVEVSATRSMGEISDEVTRRERFADRPELDDIFDRTERDIGIYVAFFRHGYKLKEIGDFLGMHYTTVSRIAKRIGGD
jgi:putative transposase